MNKKVWLEKGALRILVGENESLGIHLVLFPMAALLLVCVFCGSWVAGDVALRGVGLLPTYTLTPSNTPASTNTPTVTPSVTPKPTLTPTLTPIPAPTSPFPTYTEAYVVRVIDGDTIVVRINDQEYNLRYIGIDCPEPNHKLGPAVTMQNTTFVERKTVYLEKDVSETDRDGRLLRYVWLSDGTLINERLVQIGYATAVAYPPDTKYQERFEQAQALAQTEQVGLWRVISTPTPLPPRNCWNAVYIKDVTIPDGTYIAPGKTFVKTWRVRNAGACVWENVTLSFDSGSQMSGHSVTVDHIAPGEQTDVTVSLTAPAGRDTYRATWRFHSNGTTFGNLTVVITTVPVPTPRPTVRSVPLPTSPPRSVPLPTSPPPAPAAACDCSGDIYNCDSFATHNQAQACFAYCISIGRGDIHRLDRDNDGIACESLP